MAGFLLDVHLPLAVADALRRLVPNAEIEHISRWHEGASRIKADEEILSTAAAEDLILVTLDVSTVQTVCNRWLNEGRSFPGVVFIVGAANTSANIGGIARALAVLLEQPQLLDPAYPVVYLRPLTEAES